MESDRWGFGRAATLALFAAALALLVVFALTAAFSPLNGEDYALGIPPGAHSFLERLAWAMHRSAAQITFWNARLGEQIAIFWLSMPRPAFVAANASAFALFCMIVAWLGAGAVRASKPALVGWLATASLSLLAWPRLEVFFWGTAAAGYFHPLVLTLLILLPFGLPDARHWMAARVPILLLFALGAFAAGLSFENLPPALFVYMGLMMVAAYRRRDHDRWSLAVLAVAYAAGWALLILAPSTAHRARYYRTHLHVPPWSVSYVVDRSMNVARVFWTTSKPMLAIGLTAILFSVGAAGRTAPRALLATAPWLLAALVSVATVALAPYTEPRAFSFCWAVMLIAVAGAVARAVEARPATTVAAISALVLVALYSGASVVREYRSFGESVDVRTRYIMSNLGTARCAEGLRISAIATTSDPRILNNREEWVLASMDQVSRYFGCKLEPAP